MKTTVCLLSWIFSELGGLPVFLVTCLHGFGRLCSGLEFRGLGLVSGLGVLRVWVSSLSLEGDNKGDNTETLHGLRILELSRSERNFTMKVMCSRAPRQGQAAEFSSTRAEGSRCAEEDERKQTNHSKIAQTTQKHEAN